MREFGRHTYALAAVTVLAAGLAVVVAPPAGAEPAPTTITTTFDRTTKKSSRLTALQVEVASSGSVDGGTLTVTAGTRVQTFDVEAGSPVAVGLFKYTGGVHTITVAFGGTAAAAAATRDVSFTIRKVQPVLYVGTRPATVTRRMTHARLGISVGTGASVKGATLVVSSKATPRIVTASGKYPSPVIPQLTAGVHRWTIDYSGNRYTLPATRGYKFTVQP